MILYDGGGIAHIITPAPAYLASLPADWTDERREIYIANLTLPAGTRYELVTEADLPDTTYRDAWQYQSGPGERIATAPETIVIDASEPT